MRKFLLISVLSFLSITSFAQSVTLQQKLYYTCKVWGFVKYYHSNVSTCHVNWDSVLVSILPAVENAATDSAFNDALDTMLAAAGTMQLSTTYFPDTLAANLKYNRDWSWITASLLRTDVQIQLDTIKNNFRPHVNCYVQVNTNTNINSWLAFPDDNPELNVNTTTNYPDEHHRLLALFKYWNVVRYFYPYNYVLDIPWDTTLYNYVVPIDTVSNSYSFWLLYDKITANLDDAHVELYSNSAVYSELPGDYFPPILLKYIDSQYVVLRSTETGIHSGDAIISIDGRTTAQWEDSLKPYISAGNMAEFRYFMCIYMLGRETSASYDTLVVEDSNGTNHTFNAACNYSGNNTLFTSYYYFADSLNTISWTTMPCDIGYVNLGNMQETEINQMYSTLYNKSAIIFDLRYYPVSNAIAEIADLMYPQSNIEGSKFLNPDVTYPGTYYWTYNYGGVQGNPTPYFGKVIILMNEETGSFGEFSCMILSAMPNVIKVGSQTAGADGNISEWNLTQDLFAGFSTLGVFYPNGDSTQRIGIVPDSVVYPTKAGIRHHDDEVLDKALQIAGCNLYTQNIQSAAPSVKVYPNPADDVVNIEGNNITATNVTVNITDVTGRILAQKKIENNGGNILTQLNIKDYTAGMYIVTVKTGTQQYVTKIVKENIF